MNSPTRKDLARSKFDKRSITRHNASYAKRFRDLAHSGIVYEFGSRLDLTDLHDVTSYLEHLHSWLSEVKLPTDFDAFKSFAHDLCSKDHKRLALTLLSTKGNKRALMLCRAFQNILTKKAFDKWEDIEAQFLDTLLISTLVPMFLMIMAAVLAKKYVPPILDSISANLVATHVTPLVNTLLPAIQQGSQSLSTIDLCITKVKDICLAAWRWLKDVYKKLISCFDFSFTSADLVCTLIKVVACILAFEFARSLFPDHYHQVRDYICNKMGFKTPQRPKLYEFFTVPELEDTDEFIEAQSFSNPMNFCMEIIRRNFAKVKSSTFYAFLGEIPKCTNIAKAVMWIFENLEFLYNRILEMWTGVPRGHNAFEVDVLHYSTLVDKFHLLVNSTSAEEIHSLAASFHQTLLSAEKKRLENALQHSKNVRSIFSSMLATKSAIYLKDSESLDHKRKAAAKRPVPVWLYIKGAPGVGKTLSLEPLMHHIWKFLQDYSDIEMDKEPFTYAATYQFNQQEEFFDGYVGQFFTLIDDLFQQTDAEVRSYVAGQLINMIAPTPYSLRVADVPNKAHVHFRSRCIISTTNLKTSDFRGEDLGLVEPDALATRRTIVVEQISSDKYRLTDGCVLFDKAGNRGPITLDVASLASLVAECIIVRDKEIFTKPTMIPMERLSFGFQGGRMRIPILNDHGVLVAPPRGTPHLLMQPPRSMKRPSIYQPPSTYVPKHRNKGKERETDTKEDTEDVPVEEAQMRKSTEIVLEKCEEVIDDPVVAPEHYPPTSDEILAVLKHSRMCLGVSEDPIFVPLSPSDEPESSDGRRELTKTRGKPDVSDLLWDLPDYDPVPPFPAHYPQLTFIQDETILKHLPTKFVDGLFKMNPGLVLLPMNDLVAQEYYSTVINDPVPLNKLFHMWFNSHHSRHKLHAPHADMDPAFWDPFVVRNRDLLKSFTKDFVYRALVTASKRTSIFNSLLITGGVIAVGIIAIKKLLSVVMPSSAHEVAQGYEDTPRLQKLVTRRANARVVKRLQKHGPKAQGDPYRNAMIGNNCEVLEMRYAPKTMSVKDVMKLPPTTSSWCLFVFERCALVPLHTIFAHGEDDDDCIRYISLSKHMDYCISTDDLELCEEIRGDVGIVRFPLINMKRNILSSFVQDLPPSGRYEHLQPHIETTSFELTVALSTEPIVKHITISSQYETFETDISFHGIRNYNGMCGTPYLHRPTGLITAIHMAGNRSAQIGYGVMIFQSDLAKYYLDIPQVMVPITTSLTPATVIPGVEVIGCVSAQMASWCPKETSYVQSPFDIPNFIFPETRDGPAHLAPVGDKSPIKVALGGFATQSFRHKAPPRLKNLIDFLPTAFDASAIRLLTLEEAIFGIPGYIKSLDTATSAGYFYKRAGFTRRKLFFDENGKPYIHPVLRRSIERKFEMLTRGIIVPGVFEETLKDEVRSEEKNLEFKSRLFAAGDLDTLILQRIIFGTFIAEAEKDPSGCPCALGLNVHSKHWAELYSRLRQDPHVPMYLGAGDFTQWDISLKNDISEEFITLVSYYHPFPNLVRDGFALMSYAWHILSRVLFLRPSGTSSGALITSIFNTFGNWAIHKKAFLALYDEDDWKYVNTTFTGDDSIFTRPLRFEKYTMQYLQSFFDEWYSMVYTSPFKDVSFDVTWENLTYLKRTFVLTSRGVMAPLAQRSIANAAKWTHKNADVEQLFSTLDSLMLEFWHYGPEVYNRGRLWCIAQSARLGTPRNFITWQAMVELRTPGYAS